MHLCHPLLYKKLTLLNRKNDPKTVIWTQPSCEPWSKACLWIQPNKDLSRAIFSLPLHPTASHSTSQLSQKLKTTYKASTSKVMRENHRWDHHGANKISHLCQYLNFFGSNAAWIKSPFVTVLENWRLACLFLPPRSWLVKRRRSIEIPWVIRQSCNISPLKASHLLC